MATLNPTQLNAGDRCEKASGKLWSTRFTMTEAGEREDAWGILLGAGLFSITIITFIIQSYRLLSPDAADEAKALTCVVFAVAIQQRARGYMKLAPCPDKGACMHVDAISDAKKSQMSRAIETTTTYYTYPSSSLCGLVEFLFHINKIIAFFALIYISAAAFVYMALT
ncbi:hypothetical protein BGW80DRAFT_1367085, partial [Lactifluus volemus]